jgi:tetratricopeptide (TPR) repeat protein
MQGSLSFDLLSHIESLEKPLAPESIRVSLLADAAESASSHGSAKPPRVTQPLENPTLYENDETRVHCLLGKALESQGNYDEALEAYLVAWQQDPEHTEAEAALLREDFLLKTHLRSVEKLPAVLAQQPDGQLWRLLARACETKGNDSKAIAFLTEVLRAQPDDVASMAILARLFEKHGEMEQAEQWHRRILLVNPILRVSNLFLAQRYYVQGKYEEAIPYFERLLFLERMSGEQDGTRVFELYWLLAQVKSKGISGFEQRIAEVRRWKDLTTEERPLVQDLLVFARRKDSRKEDSPSIRLDPLHAPLYPPLQDETSTLSETEEKTVSQVHREREDTQLPAGDGETAALDTWTTVWVTALQEEHQRTRQAVRKAMAWKVGLGLVTCLLLIKGLGEERTTQDRLEQTASPAVQTVRRPTPEEVPQTQPTTPLLPITEQRQIPSEEPKKVVQITESAKEKPSRGEGKATATPQGRSSSKHTRNAQPMVENSQVGETSFGRKSAQEQTIARPAVEQQSLETVQLPMPAQPKNLEEENEPAPPAVSQLATRSESSRSPSLPPPVSVNLLAEFSSRLPDASYFPIGERMFTQSSAHLWRVVTELVAQETDVIHVEDGERHVIHGEVLARGLRPRANKLRPQGHYLVAVTPGASADTNLVQVQILAFDWQTKKPVADAAALPARFFTRLEKKIVGTSSAPLGK